MWLLVGLGNPGRDYEHTRHNAGFIAVDKIVEHYHLQPAGSKFHAECFKGSINGQGVFLIKPQTFMNRSGISIGEAARFYKIPPAQIAVFYDDLDLIPGKLRVKCGGTHGGHNGLKDTDRVIGTDYWRIRLGIGHPGHKDRVTGYVLGTFTAEEARQLDLLSDAAALHVPWLLQGEPDKMMNGVALTLQQQAAS